MNCQTGSDKFPTHHFFMNLVPTQLLMMLSICCRSLTSTGTLEHSHTLYDAQSVQCVHTQSHTVHMQSHTCTLDDQMHIVHMQTRSLDCTQTLDCRLLTPTHPIPPPSLHPSPSHLMLSFNSCRMSSRACLNALITTVGCICCSMNGPATESISPATTQPRWSSG